MRRRLHPRQAWRSTLRSAALANAWLLGWAGCAAAPQEPAAATQPAAAAGVTYYADAEQGNDDADGRAPERAFRSLDRAVRALDRAGGDTLVLRGVFRETLHLARINALANAARPTTVRCATDPRGKPLRAAIDGGIDGAASFPFDRQGRRSGLGPGTDDRHLDRGIVVTECNYVGVDGIEVRGIAGTGVLSWRSSHVAFTNLEIEWIAESAMLLANGQPDDPPTVDLVVANCRINQSNLGRFLDRDHAEPRKRGYDMRSETLSVVRFDGFDIHHNHVSNSLMEGIDFKAGARHGEVHHNIVELTRSAGIYANEGVDSKIYRNVVRCIGYYDPQDGSGIQIAVDYARGRLPVRINEQGAFGILVSNGDLDAPGRPRLEHGRVSDIDVFENVVSWTRMGGVFVNNAWRVKGRDGGVAERIRVYNNVAYRTCQGDNRLAAGVQIDIGVTGALVANNIIADSGNFDIEVLTRRLQSDAGTALTAFFAGNRVTHNLTFDNARRGHPGDQVLAADPRFVRPSESPGATADFRLRADSPAKGAGIDVDNTTAKGKAVDLGAFPDGESIWSAGREGRH